MVQLVLMIKMYHEQNSVNSTIRVVPLEWMLVQCDIGISMLHDIMEQSMTYGQYLIL